MQITVQHSAKKFGMVGWLCGDAGRVLVVDSIPEVERLRDAHPKLASRILYWKEAVQTLPAGCTEVGIDGAERVLEEIFSSRLTRVTINK